MSDASTQLECYNAELQKCIEELLAKQKAIKAEIEVFAACLRQS